MSNIVNTIKDKVTGKHHDKPNQQPHQNEDEQTFSIQPHPAVSTSYKQSPFLILTGGLRR